MSDSRPPTGARGMTPAELADVEAIFAEAADSETAVRGALLAARCAGRPRIQAEVEALLRSHDRLGVFLDPLDNAEREPPEEAADTSGRLKIGSTIGPYRLVERIGAGGMGDVYLAERADGVFAHRVAVKVTRASVREKDTRRFRSERQILASLQHPHIVTLLDGGATETGEAYLVMEHVAGAPITQYCAGSGTGEAGAPDRTVPLEARLRLMAQVCSAVQYAHRHGIVHRDLKPANILVTADGVPKVLDFGVAKLLEGAAPEDATMTRALAAPLTPNYASPEQLRGLPITTASDVYALGVLTYEVVAGRRPYDTSGKTLDQVLELVLNTEPPRPSTAVSSSSSPGRHDSYRRDVLKGDLDAIVLKAMSKEPERRYGSAGELADDLERFLTGKPVVAREPSLGYVVRRLAARNKVAVAILAASLVAILSALGIALWQRQVAVRAQARAEQRFKDVRQLANALIFKIHDAVMPLPGSTPVRQTIVNEALAYLERLEAESKGDESLQIELSSAYRQIGSILGDPGRPNLGDRDGAMAQFEKARNLVLPLVERPTPSFQAMAALVNIDVLMSSVLKRNRETRGRTLADEAVKYAETLTKIPNAHPEAGALLARATFNLAGALSTEDSIGVWQRTVELYEAEARRRSNDPAWLRNVALAEKYLGGNLDTLGRLSEAEIHYRRALEIDEKNFALAPDNRTARFDLAIDLANVASVLEAQGRVRESHAMFERSLAMRKLLSDSDPTDQLSKARYGFALIRVARLDLMLGDKAAALAHAQEAVTITQSVLGVTKDPSSQSDSAKAVAVLGDVKWAMDDRVNACLSYRRAQRIFAAHEAMPGELFYVNIVKRGLEKCGKAQVLK